MSSHKYIHVFIHSPDTHYLNYLIIRTISLCYYYFHLLTGVLFIYIIFCIFIGKKVEEFTVLTLCSPVSSVTRY